jgi:hypothetical protein
MEPCPFAELSYGFTVSQKLIRKRMKDYERAKESKKKNWSVGRFFAKIREVSYRDSGEPLSEQDLEIPLEMVLKPLFMDISTETGVFLRMDYINHEEVRIVSKSWKIASPRGAFMIVEQYDPIPETNKKALMLANTCVGQGNEKSELLLACGMQ